MDKDIAVGTIILQVFCGLICLAIVFVIWNSVETSNDFYHCKNIAEMNQTDFKFDQYGCYIKKDNKWIMHKEN